MLPRLLPMLAVAAEPFDSPEYSFEIKYDGVRALAAVDEMGWRLWGRERADYTARYPELDVLRRLPAGTLVDGELGSFRRRRPPRPAPAVAPWSTSQYIGTQNSVPRQPREGLLGNGQEPPSGAPLISGL